MMKSHSISVTCCQLCTLASDTSGKLDIFGHDGHTLGVDGAQVRVFKQTHEVCLTGLLKNRSQKIQSTYREKINQIL